jgi:tetrahydromethanopterin S-methyltransferase subunit F
MGVDKFYKYDGRVQTLNCNLRRYVFSDFNKLQSQQVYAGTNEGFNEVWWFYCSADSDVADRYVIYNYVEDIWYYGNMGRTAWLDSGLLPYPIAATYNYELVQHEDGVDAYDLGIATALPAHISSSEFDIEDGHNLGFVWRVLPDLTFENSANDSTTGAAPKVTMTLYALQNSGSGVGTTANANVTKGSNYVITEEFTGQIYTRARGRQLIFRISSNQIGTTWQLGAPRIDIRPDGRR